MYSHTYMSLMHIYMYGGGCKQCSVFGAVHQGVLWQAPSNQTYPRRKHNYLLHRQGPSAWFALQNCDLQTRRPEHPRVSEGCRLSLRRVPITSGSLRALACCKPQGFSLPQHGQAAKLRSHLRSQAPTTLHLCLSRHVHPEISQKRMDPKLQCCNCA